MSEQDTLLAFTEIKCSFSVAKTMKTRSYRTFGALTLKNSNGKGSRPLQANSWDAVDTVAIFSNRIWFCLPESTISLKSLTTW